MKTAVKWLVEEMFKQSYLNDKPLTVNNIEYFVKQAEEMEKEQRIKVYQLGYDTGYKVCEMKFNGLFKSE
jgi:hypothetical protein